jgi:hypothetical protein
MSAYLVPEKQIAAISKWYFTNTKFSDRHCYNVLTDTRIELKESEELAMELAIANVMSINSRYSENNTTRDTQYIKDCMTAAEIETIGGGMMIVHDPDMDISAASIWNLCCNLNYQSCEVDDWIRSDAYWLIRAIKDRAAEKGMNTHSARMTWGWVDAA